MNLRSLRAWVNLGYAFMVFGLVLAFLLATGPRGIAWLDGADYQRRVALQDVGEGPWQAPLFVLLAQPFLLIPWESVPRRVALASAVFGAGACLTVYLLLKSLLAAAPQFIARRVGLIGALALAVSHTFWLRAVTPGAETLDALLLAATLYGVVHFAEQGRVPYLYGALFLLGLSFANNLMMLFLLPVFAIYVRVVKPPLVRDIGRVRARGLIVLAVGASVALALTAWGWSAAGFTISPERASWVTFWRGHARLTPEEILPSALHFGAFFLYSFAPLTWAFAIIGSHQISRREKAFFWLVFPLFVIYSGLTILLILDQPMNAYALPWVLVAIAAGYGWWKTLADGGYRDFLLALGLTLAPVVLYHFTPSVVERLEVTAPTLRYLDPPFEANVDPLAHYLNPDRHQARDAREDAQASLDALPPTARIVPVSRAGELALAPLRYLHDVEARGEALAFLDLSRDPALLTRLASDPENPLLLAGLHPPHPEVEGLLDRYFFLPTGTLFRVVPREEVPGRTTSDQEETVPLSGQWYGFERPQGYAVSFSMREAPEGSLSGTAVLNEGGARPLEGVFTRLTLVSGALAATVTHADRYNIHLEGTASGNRIEGTWYVYQAPELRGSFVVWKQ